MNKLRISDFVPTNLIRFGPLPKNPKIPNNIPLLYIYFYFNLLKYTNCTKIFGDTVCV